MGVRYLTALIKAISVSACKFKTKTDDVCELYLLFWQARVPNTTVCDHCTTNVTCHMSHVPFASCHLSHSKPWSFVQNIDTVCAKSQIANKKLNRSNTFRQRCVSVVDTFIFTQHNPNLHRKDTTIYICIYISNDLQVSMHYFEPPSPWEVA